MMKPAKMNEKNIFSQVITDPSAALLLISNLVTLAFAIYENWALTTIMLIYWCQSVIIGFFNFIKILTLKNYMADGLAINGKPVTTSENHKIVVALFFAMHYGMFHAVYLGFILMGLFFPFSPFSGQQGAPQIDGFYVLLAAPIFFVNHLFSFFYNRGRDSMKMQHIGKVMFMPYARIIPMHLTIIFGSTGAIIFDQGIVVVFFMVLKTAADLVMHAVEHA